jgi:hypothetical protein
MFGLKTGMDATGGDFNRLRRGVSPLVCDGTDRSCDWRDDTMGEVKARAVRAAHTGRNRRGVEQARDGWEAPRVVWGR